MKNWKKSNNNNKYFVIFPFLNIEKSAFCLKKYLKKLILYC